MDSRPVPPEFLTAGADYLAAMRRLGLDPIFLGWGWDREDARWILVMITSILDAGGPLALNDLLFKAYNAEATPKAISPFIVRVFSPEILPRSHFGLLNDPYVRINSVNGEERDIAIRNAQTTILGIDFERINTYPATGKPIEKYTAQRDAWQRFKRQVDRLAA